jgi:hypothetical protein
LAGGAGRGSRSTVTVLQVLLVGHVRGVGAGEAAFRFLRKGPGGGGGTSSREDSKSGVGSQGTVDHEVTSPLDSKCHFMMSAADMPVGGGKRRL